MTDERPVGHLQRRKIEGRVLVPFIAVCHEKLGEEIARELVAAFIRQTSIGDGAKSAGASAATWRACVVSPRRCRADRALIDASDAQSDDRSVLAYAQFYKK